MVSYQFHKISKQCSDLSVKLVPYCLLVHVISDRTVVKYILGWC